VEPLVFRGLYERVLILTSLSDLTFIIFTPPHQKSKEGTGLIMCVAALARASPRSSCRPFPPAKSRPPGQRFTQTCHPSAAHHYL
jgi:hypothetical protein